MWKKYLLFVLIILICGCQQRPLIKNVKGKVSINYPITNINALDDAISSYINNIYKEFKNNDSENSTLDISYTYKDINDDIINISLSSEIKVGKTIHKIKTFTYNKKTDMFLTMEDIVRDVDVLDYDVKRLLLQKYRDVDIEYLSNVSLEYFKIDDENLTIYFNPTKIESNSEVIYLDIPLNSLQLLIDLDKERDDTYISIKKKDISINDKVVALTFDDGPSKYTNKILDVLKKYKAYATFFVVGNKAYFQGDVLRRMLSEGNEIGNHSYDHKRLNNLSESEFKDEINKTQEIIKDLTGFTPTLFRPTYGGYTKKLMSYTDLTFVLWDVDSRDWAVKSKEKILENVLPYVKSGSIVLMHDNHKYALDSIEDIIKELKGKGYKFVTVSELLKLKSMGENE